MCPVELARALAVVRKCCVYCILYLFGIGFLQSSDWGCGDDVLLFSQGGEPSWSTGYRITEKVPKLGIINLPNKLWTVGLLAVWLSPRRLRQWALRQGVFKAVSHTECGTAVPEGWGPWGKTFSRNDLFRPMDCGQTCMAFCLLERVPLNMWLLHCGFLGF